MSNCGTPQILRLGKLIIKLHIPYTYISIFLSVLGVKLWNYLDSEIKQSKTIYSFKSKYEYYINITSSQICC